MDASTFRKALGQFPSGVTVVGVPTPDGPRGITVSAFLSLSLEPPLVGVAINHGAKAHELLGSAEHYGVSILASDQSNLSDFFAGRPGDTEFRWLESSGAPTLEGALVQLGCRIVARHAVGDHTLYVGQIEHAEIREGEPLLYHRGRYTQPA